MISIRWRSAQSTKLFSPPLKLSADKVQLRLQLAAEQAGADFKLTVADAAFSLADLALASGAQTPFKLARLGFTDGAVDLAARHASIGRLYAEGGQMQLTRDRKGQLNILSLLPKFGAVGQHAAPSKAPAAGAAWIAMAKSVELSKFGAEVEDQDTGIKVHVQDLAVKLEGAGSDLTKPVGFNAGLKLREGGQLSAQGKVVPASGTLEADVRVKQLALAPLQPLLGKYVKLRIAGGSVSAQGRDHCRLGRGEERSPALCWRVRRRRPRAQRRKWRTVRGVEKRRRRQAHREHRSQSAADSGTALGRARCQADHRE